MISVIYLSHGKMLKINVSTEKVALERKEFLDNLKSDDVKFLCFADAKTENVIDIKPENGVDQC